MFLGPARESGRRYGRKSSPRRRRRGEVLCSFRPARRQERVQATWLCRDGRQSREPRAEPTPQAMRPRQRGSFIKLRRAGYRTSPAECIRCRYAAPRRQRSDGRRGPLSTAWPPNASSGELHSEGRRPTCVVTRIGIAALRRERPRCGKGAPGMIPRRRFPEREGAAWTYTPALPGRATGFETTAGVPQSLARSGHHDGRIRVEAWCLGRRAFAGVEQRASNRRFQPLSRLFDMPVSFRYNYDCEN